MRNSLILYSEWYEILRELPDEDRLRALDAILQYGFEDVEPSDKYIKAITALIFKGIDKTRTRYDEKCEKNRQNIQKRWNEYKRIRSNTNEYKRIQSLQMNTNATNYNNNYNDNYELANANNINKEIKENIIKEKKENKAFIDEYFAKQTFIESFCMQNQTTPEVIRQMAEAIIIEWDAAGVNHADYTEAHNHLTSTLRIRIRDNKRNGNNNNNNVDNRPPRPSVHHIWSESQQKWVYSI